jgi:hypothetical protein
MIRARLPAPEVRLCNPRRRKKRHNRIDPRFNRATDVFGDGIGAFILATPANATVTGRQAAKP